MKLAVCRAYEDLPDLVRLVASLGIEQPKRTMASATKTNDGPEPPVDGIYKATKVVPYSRGKKGGCQTVARNRATGQTTSRTSNPKT